MATEKWSCTFTSRSGTVHLGVEVKELILSVGFDNGTVSAWPQYTRCELCVVIFIIVREKKYDWWFRLVFLFIFFLLAEFMILVFDHALIVNLYKMMAVHVLRNVLFCFNLEVNVMYIIRTLKR